MTGGFFSGGIMCRGILSVSRPIHVYLFGGRFSVYDAGSLVGLCTQDYKSLSAAITICDTLVNIDLLFGKYFFFFQA